MNWNDLRYLLAVAQTDSLKGAARLVGVDKTTVSRRLRALEQSLSQPVVEKSATGLILTEFGRSLMRHAEAMQAEVQAIRAQANADPVVHLGTVRVTSVPLVVNHILLPNLRDLLSRSAGLRVELISEARDLSLLQGEADIALRLARPSEGGQGILARKLGDLAYGAYVGSNAPEDAPWLNYDRRMQYLTHAAALASASETTGERAFAASFNDAETLYQALLAGYGKTLLPRIIGSADERLREVPFPFARLPSREIWVLVRRELRELERIRVTVDWIDRIFRL
ncbi:MAG: LysR family transcriptional regulator [Ruegeria sp.]